MTEPIGTCCVVLHTHLPWLAHHGTWPVGEEWLHQSWSASYLRVLDVLEQLADEGCREVLTLGVTPVLAAQLDDEYCLREFHTWLGYWQTRAQELTQRRDRHLRDLGAYEYRLATTALDLFETRWRHGGTAVIRRLADAGVIEVLGGPATHPFLPLLADRVARAQLRIGLEDGTRRLGRRPPGIWAPECGYRPGLESMYAAANITHFVMDGPTLVNGVRHRRHAHDNLATGDAWRVGDSAVVTFARDLDVTYRVWSPRHGYPGGRHYRDFHTFDHPTGIRPARVTSARIAPEDKAPYDPVAGHAAVAADVDDFVAVVRRRLDDLAAARGRPGLVLVGYDTELFGHWWHEGPLFLAAVLRELPRAGVRVTTLQRALDTHPVAGTVRPDEGSWGSGKDWRVWSGDQVRAIRESSDDVQNRVLRVVDKQLDGEPPHRRLDLDALLHEALLATSSDWAFMVTKDSAAAYARERVHEHTRRFDQLADRIESGRPADRLVRQLRRVDGVFGHLDARILGLS